MLYRVYRVYRIIVYRGIGMNMDVDMDTDVWGFSIQSSKKIELDPFARYREKRGRPSKTHLPRPQSLHRKPRMTRRLGRDDDRLDLRVVEYFLKVGLAAVLLLIVDGDLW